jgi:FliI/YscN family ATPase
MDELPLIHAAADGWIREGTVVSVSATSVSIDVPGLSTGAVVRIERKSGDALMAEVVAISGRIATCCPLGDTRGIETGSRASADLSRVGAFVGASLLGRAVDAWGRSSGAGEARIANLDAHAVPLEARGRIDRPLTTGIGAIDAFAPIGHGQRIALFAGAGIGKTTLLRRIVDEAQVDARVVALVGERAREAAETVAAFERGDRWTTTTVVCATAQTPPVERLAAARTATAHAEALAEDGRDVLLVVDSLTRVATAWREIALAAGEAPAHRGHPASLASVIAALVERAGARKKGSVTAIYAVLVDGDDLREPVTDTIRALLDGHVVLSRAFAESGRFPAIDVLRCVSRLMPDIADRRHIADAADVRRAMAMLERAEDLFAIGAYEPGGDAALDAAVEARDAIEALIFDGAAPSRRAIAELAAIAARLRGCALTSELRG